MAEAEKRVPCPVCKGTRVPGRGACGYCGGMGDVPAWLVPVRHTSLIAARTTAYAECVTTKLPIVVFAERVGEDSFYRTLTRGTFDALDSKIATGYVPLLQTDYLGFGLLNTRSWNDVRAAEEKHRKAGRD